MVSAMTIFLIMVAVNICRKIRNAVMYSHNAIIYVMFRISDPRVEDAGGGGHADHPGGRGPLPLRRLPVLLQGDEQELLLPW